MREDLIPKQLRSLAAAEAYVRRRRVEAVKRKFPPWYCRMNALIAVLLLGMSTSLPIFGLMALSWKLAYAGLSYRGCVASVLPFYVLVFWISNRWAKAINDVEDHPFADRHCRKEAVVVATDPVAVRLEAIELLRDRLCGLLPVPDEESSYRHFAGSPVRVRVEAAAEACLAGVQQDAFQMAAFAGTVDHEALYERLLHAARLSP